jgi:hypothetical protein
MLAKSNLLFKSRSYCEGAPKELCAKPVASQKGQGASLTVVAALGHAHWCC